MALSRMLKENFSKSKKLFNCTIKFPKIISRLFDFLLNTKHLTPSHSITQISPLFTDALSCQLGKKYELFPGARLLNPQEFRQLNQAIVERLESLVNDDNGQSAGWHCLQIRIPACQEPHYAGYRNLRFIIHHDFSKFVGGVPSIACLTNPLGECRVCPSSMTMEGQKNFRYVPKCAGTD